MLKIPIPKQPFDHNQFICDIGGRGEEDTVKRNGLGHCQDYEALRQSGKRKLFPVRLLDFATLRDWKCFDADSGKDLAVELREYFIPDFSNWKEHDQFEAAFSRLLNDLRAEERAK